MRKTVKLYLTALTAALLLVSAVSTASARTLSVSNPNLRATWTSLEFVSSLATVRCEVTLEGTLHARTIQKRVGTLIGYITAVTVRRPCRGGEAWAANGIEAHPRLGTIASTLPWHITYEGFTGILPNIREIIVLLRGFRNGMFKLQATSFGISALCLYGRPEDNISGRLIREAGGAISGLEPITGRNSASLVAELGGTGLCPRTGVFQNTGVGVVTLLGSSTTRIIVTLI